MNDKFEDRDEFNRKAIGEKLISILASENNISPLVINGRWGSGKTEFCLKVINLSKEKTCGFESAYINVFQYDYTDAPLIMLISSILKVVKSETDKKALITKAVPLIKCGGKILGKAAVSWLLKENVEVLGEDLSKALTSESDKILDDLIAGAFKNFKDYESNIEAFKKLLQKIAKDEPIVIFIDELDRCRPGYALSLLEIIKHVFDVDGVKFVFVTNLEQLEKVVKLQYGDIDAREYLTKFFKFEMRLPDIMTKSRTNLSLNSYVLFVGLLGNDKAFAKILNTAFVGVVKNLFSRSKLSLRDAEKLYLNLQILNSFESVYSINERTQYGYASLIFVSVYIYTFFPELADKLINFNAEESDISLFFGLDKSVFNDFSDSKDFIDTLYALIIHDMDGSKINPQDATLCKQYSSMLFSGLNIGYVPGVIVLTIAATIREMHLSPVALY